MSSQKALADDAWKFADSLHSIRLVRIHGRPKTGSVPQEQVTPHSSEVDKEAVELEDNTTKQNLPNGRHDNCSSSHDRQNQKEVE